MDCPCGSLMLYTNCCQIFHSHIRLPDTAEQLMRSRYSAYALRLVDYLIDTTHPDKLKSSYRIKLMSTIYDIQWTQLLITKTTAGGKDAKSGKVVFEASYIEKDVEGVMRENSRFKRVAGKWYYYDGKG